MWLRLTGRLRRKIEAQDDVLCKRSISTNMSSQRQRERRKQKQQRRRRRHQRRRTYPAIQHVMEWDYAFYAAYTVRQREKKRGKKRKRSGMMALNLNIIEFAGIDNSSCIECPIFNLFLFFTGGKRRRLKQAQIDSCISLQRSGQK